METPEYYISFTKLRSIEASGTNLFKRKLDVSSTISHDKPDESSTSIMEWYVCSFQPKGTKQLQALKGNNSMSVRFILILSVLAKFPAFFSRRSIVSCGVYCDTTRFYPLYAAMSGPRRTRARLSEVHYLARFPRGADFNVIFRVPFRMLCLNIFLGVVFNYVSTLAGVKLGPFNASRSGFLLTTDFSKE